MERNLIEKNRHTEHCSSSLLVAVSAFGFRFNFRFIIGCTTAVKHIPFQRLRRVYLKANVQRYSNRNRVICIWWKINILTQHLFSASLHFFRWENRFRIHTPTIVSQYQSVWTVTNSGKKLRVENWFKDILSLFYFTAFDWFLSSPLWLQLQMFRPRPTFRFNVDSFSSLFTSTDYYIIFFNRCHGKLCCMRRIHKILHSFFLSLSFQSWISPKGRFYCVSFILFYDSLSYLDIAWNVFI